MSNRNMEQQLFLHTYPSLFILICMHFIILYQILSFEKSTLHVIQCFLGTEIPKICLNNKQMQIESSFFENICIYLIDTMYTAFSHSKWTEFYVFLLVISIRLSISTRILWLFWKKTNNVSPAKQSLKNTNPKMDYMIFRCFENKTFIYTWTFDGHCYTKMIILANLIYMNPIFCSNL